MKLNKRYSRYSRGVIFKTTIPTKGQHGVQRHALVRGCECDLSRVDPASRRMTAVIGSSPPTTLIGGRRWTDFDDLSGCQANFEWIVNTGPLYMPVSSYVYRHSDTNGRSYVTLL